MVISLSYGLLMWLRIEFCGRVSQLNPKWIYKEHRSLRVGDKIGYKIMHPVPRQSMGHKLDLANITDQECHKDSTKMSIDPMLEFHGR